MMIPPLVSFEGFHTPQKVLTKQRLFELVSHSLTFFLQKKVKCCSFLLALAVFVIIAGFSNIFDMWIPPLVNFELVSI